MSRRKLTRRCNLGASILSLADDLRITLFFTVYPCSDRRSECYCRGSNGRRRTILCIFLPVFSGRPVPVLSKGKFLGKDVGPVNLRTFEHPKTRRKCNLRLSGRRDLGTCVCEFAFAYRRSRTCCEGFTSNSKL